MNCGKEVAFYDMWSWGSRLDPNNSDPKKDTKSKLVIALQLWKCIILFFVLINSSLLFFSSYYYSTFMICPQLCIYLIFFVSWGLIAFMYFSASLWTPMLSACSHNAVHLSVVFHMTIIIFDRLRYSGSVALSTKFSLECSVHICWKSSAIPNDIIFWPKQSRSWKKITTICVTWKKSRRKLHYNCI